MDAFCAAHLEEEIYTGVSIVKHDARVTEVTRTSNVNAAGIAGLSADIDIADPVHQKTALPQSVEEALSLVQSPPPTLLIHSGHGLQAWWLFDQPWLFASGAERTQAQRLMQWWSDRLKERAAQRGWAWDATFDMARIMRVPGTMNNKADPVPVRLIGEIGSRINLADLLLEMPLVKIRATSATANGHHLTLNSDANPPALKFETLLSISPRFKRSWEHNRTDLKDQTPSSYDMSLATMAAQAEWTDQEIADLLIAHRRKHDADLKLREDYYQRTIDRARAPGTTAAAIEQLGQSADVNATLEIISQLLGIQIDRMFRYDTNPVTFGAMVDYREIRLGEADGINSQTKFRNKMAGATLVNINVLNKEAWVAVSQKLLDICETVDMGEETRPAAELWQLLLDYLAEYPPYTDIESGVKAKRAVRTADGQIAISLPAFIGYLAEVLHRNFKRTDITIWLRSLNATPQRLSVPNYGQAYVWVLPESVKVDVS